MFSELQVKRLVQNAIIPTRGNASIDLHWQNNCDPGPDKKATTMWNTAIFHTI